MPHLELQHGVNKYSVQTFSEMDHIHRKIKESGTFYEIAVLTWIAALHAKGVYVDVGANIGNHSVWFLNECNSTAVIAVEGNPAVTPILRSNLETNRPSGKTVEIFEGFVSSHANIVFTPSDEFNIGMSSVKPAKELEAEKHHLPASTLDSILNGVSSIAFCKIDVEGHELEVLESAEETLVRCKPDLLIECWDKQFELCQWLRRKGYVKIYGDYEGNFGFTHVGGILAFIDGILDILQSKFRKRFRDRWAQMIVKRSKGLTSK